MGRDRISRGYFQGCSCLKGERIRFTLGGRRRIDPIANRRRKIGQSGAVPTAMNAEAADSTAGESLDVPNSPTRAH